MPGNPCSIISDRCELNRQIKADNALLRELKDLVAMLSELAADAAASVADQLTKLREKLIVICYQIKVTIRGMDKRTATIQAIQPKLKRYNELAQLLRDNHKEISRLTDPCEACSSVREQLRLASLRAEKEASYKHQSRETMPPAR